MASGLCIFLGEQKFFIRILFFKSNFGFVAKLRGKYRDFFHIFAPPHLAHICPANPHPHDQWDICHRR